MGSLDATPPKIVNVTRETVLTVMVYPDGRVQFVSNQPPEWVAETLQRLTDSVKAKIAHPANDDDYGPDYLKKVTG